jgi:cytoskeletal protein CcmA (bactofilin family)
MAILGKQQTTASQPMTRNGNTPQSPQINMIGEGTVVEGALKAHSDIRIRGSVIGKIRVEGKAIIAQEGNINGDLFATNADISGSVQGQIQVTETLVLKASARVTADIKTARLVVEEGAVFDGKCEMGQMTSVKADDLKKASVTPIKTAPALQVQK